MPAVKDLAKILAGVPRGSWVALSKEEDRLIAYAATLEQVLKKAKEAGEEHPVVIRVPESEVPAFLSAR